MTNVEPELARARGSVECGRITYYENLAAIPIKSSNQSNRLYRKLYFSGNEYSDFYILTAPSFALPSQL